VIDVAFAEVGAHVDEVFVTALVVVRVGLASLLVVAATVVIVLSKKHQVILLKTIKLKMLYFHSLQNQPSITAEKPFTKPPTKTEINVINLNVFYDAKNASTCCTFSGININTRHRNFLNMLNVI
jgi:hypothetical protein